MDPRGWPETSERADMFLVGVVANGKAASVTMAACIQLSALEWAVWSMWVVPQEFSLVPVLWGQGFFYCQVSMLFAGINTATWNAAK